MTEKLLVISTHGLNDPEKLLMPLIVANASLALDVPTTVFLMGASVELAVKGKAETVPALSGMPEAKNLINSIIEQGGDFQLCGPCSNHRGITADQLIANAAVGGAAGLVDMIMKQKVVSF